MASDVLTLEQRLIRYLKTGTERSFFLPGKNKLFRSGSNAMKSMIEAGQGEEAISHMKRINADKSYFKREPFLFFLATAIHSDNLEIKHAAYAIVNEVCETPMDLFVFLKHMKTLSQLCKGWGHGLRRVVCDWYNTKDPMVVAEMVTRYKEVENWSHKDVFRLSHIKPTNEGIGFIVKVVCRGLKAAKEANPEPSEVVQNLINYFEAVELVKHTEDGTTTARILEEKDLSFEHIPSTLLTSKEVWNSFLLKMTMKQLLSHLATLSRRGFLTIPSKGAKPDPLLKQIQERVLEKISDKAAIEQEKMDLYWSWVPGLPRKLYWPVRVISWDGLKVKVFCKADNAIVSPYQLYISIREYVRTFADKKKFSKSGKAEAEPMKRSASTQTDASGDHSTKKKKKKKKKGKGEDIEDNEKVGQDAEPSVNDKAKKNNPELFDALHAAFRTAVEKNLVSTDKSYCLAVKASLSELNKGIRGIPSISPLEVMALMATFLKKKEKSAQLGFFTASYSPMKYPSDLEDLIQEIVQLAAPVPNLACDPAAPINWALEKKKKFDVFLVVSDGNEARGESSPAEKLDEYRQTMNLPNTKMIICGLTAPKLDFACTRGMLDIGGFDVNVPTIINQFILGQLDQ